MTLDSGQDPSIRSAAPDMLRWLRTFEQDAFLIESVSASDGDETSLEPAIGDRFWPGPPKHRATFEGTLAEWSLDALGWLAAFLAEASARHGIRTPLLLTAHKSIEPDLHSG